MGSSQADPDRTPAASRYTVNFLVTGTAQTSFRRLGQRHPNSMPFSQQHGRGYIGKRIVDAAVGANGSASLGTTGCQGILLKGEVLFIEVDAKALNPLKTTSIHNAARMVESCATNPIKGGPARKPT